MKYSSHFSMPWLLLLLGRPFFSVVVWVLHPSGSLLVAVQVHVWIEQHPSDYYWVPWAPHTHAQK